MNGQMADDVATLKYKLLKTAASAFLLCLQTIRIKTTIPQHAAFTCNDCNLREVCGIISERSAVVRCDIIGGEMCDTMLMLDMHTAHTIIRKAK